jgi:hypothetical protein
VGRQGEEDLGRLRLLEDGDILRGEEEEVEAPALLPHHALGHMILALKRLQLLKVQWLADKVLLI